MGVYFCCYNRVNLKIKKSSIQFNSHYNKSLNMGVYCYSYVNTILNEITQNIICNLLKLKFYEYLMIYYMIIMKLIVF